MNKVQYIKKTGTPEEIIKAVTDDLQPSPNKVLSASRIFSGLIKNYNPIFQYMDQENFSGVNYTLTRLDGGSDELKEAVVGARTDSDDAITNAGLQGTMKLLKKVIPVASSVYRDDFLAYGKGTRAYQNAITEYASRFVSKAKLRQMWNGDTAGSRDTAFDGFAKLINNNSDVTDYDGTAETTYSSILKGAFKKIPEDYDEGNYYIFVNKDARIGFEDELDLKGGDLAFTYLINNKKVTFRGDDFVTIPGLANNEIYFARKEDLVVIDGAFTLAVKDEVDMEEVVYIIWRGWCHANLRNPKAIVRATHTMQS